MSVAKCQEIVDILEVMLLDAQLIYSGNKNSVVRMKKGVVQFLPYSTEKQYNY
jgi:hypothetical protein